MWLSLWPILILTWPEWTRIASHTLPCMAMWMDAEEEEDLGKGGSTRWRRTAKRDDWPAKHDGCRGWTSGARQTSTEDVKAYYCIAKALKEEEEQEMPATIISSLLSVVFLFILLITTSMTLVFYVVYQYLSCVFKDLKLICFANLIRTLFPEIEFFP